VRVVGGHQPRVSWLSWLELNAEEVDALPKKERRWVVPAAREARDFLFPVVPAPRAWWAILPRRLPNEAAVAALAPILLQILRRRLKRALKQGETAPSSWWEFPNPRNLELLQQPGARMLAPRTARTLQVAWDPCQHHIKGTNTLIAVAPDAVLSPLALFGLLNSAPLQLWVMEHGRLYHGCRVLQEPKDMIRLPIPWPIPPDRSSLLQVLEKEARGVIDGKNCWNRIHSVACALYT